MSIIQLAEEREEFVEDVDGFVYWWPDRVNGQGHLSEGNLRELADELARRNKEWQETIERDFAVNSFLPVSEEDLVSPA